MKTQQFNPDSLILAVDSHNGIYSPLVFIERYGKNIAGITDEQMADLSDVNNEFYLEAWEEVERLPVIIDGKEYAILQNEDIWLSPANMEIPEDFWI